MSDSYSRRSRPPVRRSYKDEGDDQIAGTSANYHRFSRGGYNTQQSNSFNRSRNRQDVPYASRNENFISDPYSTEQCNIQYFDSARLEALSKMDRDSLIAVLVQRKTEFERLLNSTLKSDLLVATLHVLATLCRGNVTGKMISILSRVCSDTFLNCLEAFLTSLCFEQEAVTKKHNKLYWGSRNEFWQNLVEVWQKIIVLLPGKARDELTGILGKTSAIIKSIESNQDYVIKKNVKEAVSQLFDELQGQLKKREQKTVICRTIAPESNERPPQNFRFLSVVPTEEDLFDNEPFIRANRINEPYDSVEQYLDVQFRLLREDFLAPLRQGFEEYLNEPTKRRNSNFRIYRKVRFVYKKTAELQSGYTIFFGIKNVNWKDSKRLMFGGLLCLSRDDFNTILFATIASRDEDDLKEGILVIKPCDGTIISGDFYKHDFVMLESKLYFEPYFVVLNAMRQMSDSNFPMKNYLVDADASTCRPHYLDSDRITLKYKNFELPLAANGAWPSPAALGFDEMQYEAFKCALTQELVLIQGPPGTGKTFLALQIIRTLLNRPSYWCTYGPIIIVCLTNHALDQFLESILDYTQSIVRIGGRSKNPRLNSCTLKNRLQRRRDLTRSRVYDSFDEDDDYFQYQYEVQDVTKPTYAEENMKDARKALNENLIEIQNIYTFIQNLTEENAIVPISQLKKYCKDPILNNFQTNRQLLIWLFEGDFTFDAQNDLTDMASGSESPWTSELLAMLLSYRDSQVIFPLACIDELITEIERQIRLCRSRAVSMHELPFDPTNCWEYDIYELRMLGLSVQQALAQHPLATTENQDRRYQSPQWEIYWRWITLGHTRAIYTLSRLQRQSNWLADELNETKKCVDLEMLREHKIIGLTTTAAARLHESLVRLGAPIVLVEEAAEILEAQVVCSLTESCQQVILIGDHKQLRPKPAVHELGTKYNLNISLFERMVNIRGNYTQLTKQHRMRPEIAKLISPAIYETLHNHESVCKYPSVKGLTKNLFFLHHTHKEISFEYNEDSWSNPHEAKFLVAFARHLVLQGYHVSEITILCTYTGQLSTLSKEKSRYRLLGNLHITTVDNYQGEENKIILLSLVRNNGEGNIGFLKEENRVCVALSRAREGLYIMGNINDLTTKNRIWPKIRKVLEADNAIGESLELRCQNHPEESALVQDAKDFQKCPEGGCLKRCHADLPCGHICQSVCHSLEHEYDGTKLGHYIDYECSEPCGKTCPNGHPCPLRCAQDCEPCLAFDDYELKCGHTVSIPCLEDCDTFLCPTMVDAILPDCNHAVIKPCHKSLADYPCSHPCDIRVACGHSCELKCHVNNDPDHLMYNCKKECTRNNLNCTMEHACTKRCGETCTLCNVMMKKERSCGHFFDCQCSQDVEEVSCTKPCKRKMDCGHVCQLRCNEICGECKVEVEKLSSCGHMIKVQCEKEATPSKCNAECQLKLACGHPCTASCKNPCITTCKIMTRRAEPGLCGHVFSVPCYIQESGDLQKLLRYCKEPCNTKLACGHMCKGNCGLCKQGRIHTPCGENCGNILVCGHKCEAPCRQECPPCKKMCEVKCRHNKCKRKCGEPCAPCKQKCGWGCPHSRCSKSCFEFCDREPCEEPCDEDLKCGHPCVGFCGEPCPKLCRICNKAELIDEFFLGNEGKPDARFILLEDCGHCIESEGLLEWIKTCNESVKIKTCPRCTTLINKCMRIMNQIKIDVKDVHLIKKRIFGDQTQLQNQQQLLLNDIELMAKNPVLKIFSELKNFLDAFRLKVHPVTKKKKQQILNARACEASQITFDILQQIIEKLEKIDGSVKIYPWLQHQVEMLVQSLSTRGQISNQEIIDIEAEIRRLYYMVEICKMNFETVMESSDSLTHEISFKAVIEKLTSIEKVSETTEQEIKKEIIKLAPLMEMNTRILAEERKMTVKAMNFKQGHWYKCPNGHIYSIGEYGGAMQLSTCNECKADIGGQSHRVIKGNTLASEMDGATSPAWPGGI